MAKEGHGTHQCIGGIAIYFMVNGVFLGLTVGASLSLFLLSGKDCVSLLKPSMLLLSPLLPMMHWPL